MPTPKRPGRRSRKRTAVDDPGAVAPPEVVLPTGTSRILEGALGVIMGQYKDPMEPVTQAPGGDFAPLCWGEADSAGFETKLWMGWVPGVGFVGVDEISQTGVVDADYDAVVTWLEGRAEQHGDAVQKVA